jgi:hypothetical protein
MFSFVKFFQDISAAITWLFEQKMAGFLQPLEENWIIY